MAFCLSLFVRCHTSRLVLKLRKDFLAHLYQHRCPDFRAVVVVAKNVAIIGR